eukprot:2113156-Pleurochrysis_carterae.AAC.2
MKALSTFISTHKRKHKGTPPGPNGTPFTSASLLQWVVDLLHVDLNEGNLTWKWALFVDCHVRRLIATLPPCSDLSCLLFTNSYVQLHILLCSGNVRAGISMYLKSIGLPLDLRTKEEGRIAMEKFYEGSEWHRFYCDGGDSPGGPVQEPALQAVQAQVQE